MSEDISYTLLSQKSNTPSPDEQQIKGIEITDVPVLENQAASKTRVSSLFLCYNLGEWARASPYELYQHISLATD